MGRNASKCVPFVAKKAEEEEAGEGAMYHMAGLAAMMVVMFVRVRSACRPWCCASGVCGEGV